MQFMIPIAFMALSYAQDAATPEPLPTISDLVRKLHAPRKKITSYELIIDAKQAVGEKAWAHIHHIWRDGDRYRSEHSDNFDNQGRSARHIDCTNCPAEGQFFAIHYEAQVALNKAATLAPLSDRKVLTDTRFRFKNLGATPDPVLNQSQRGIEWIIDLKIWTDKRVEPTRWKNLRAYKILLGAPNDPGKMTFEATLVPERGFAAVHARASANREGQLTVQLSESELAQVAGVWLPKACTYTEHVNGKMTEGYTQKLTFVSLNEPIDPKAFTLQEMDLIPGTLVGMGDGTTLEWDGKQLVQSKKLRYLSPLEDNKPKADERKSRSRRLLLYALAGAAFLGCGYYIRRLVKSVRARPGATLRPELSRAAMASAQTGATEDREHGNAARE